MSNRNVLNNYIVPPCGYTKCPVTRQRMVAAAADLHLNGNLPAYICFPQKEMLGFVCAEYWEKHFPKGDRNVTVASLSITKGTLADTLCSIHEAKKFAKEHKYGTVRHHMVSEAVQLNQMKMISFFWGIKNVRYVRVKNSVRPWNSIFPHEILSYGKIILYGVPALIRRLLK